MKTYIQLAEEAGLHIEWVDDEPLVFGGASYGEEEFYPKLLAFATLVRQQALGEAAQACGGEFYAMNFDMARGAHACRDAILALKEKQGKS